MHTRIRDAIHIGWMKARANHACTTLNTLKTVNTETKRLIQNTPSTLLCATECITVFTFRISHFCTQHNVRLRFKWSCTTTTNQQRTHGGTYCTSLHIAISIMPWKIFLPLKQHTKKKLPTYLTSVYFHQFIFSAEFVVVFFFFITAISFCFHDNRIWGKITTFPRHFGLVNPRPRSNGERRFQTKNQFLDMNNFVFFRFIFFFHHSKETQERFG